MSSDHASARLWTKSFTLLVIGNLFVFMSFQMLLPTLPPQAKEFGASEVQVGLVTTLFCIAAVIIRPLIGFLLESSKRKWLVIIGAASLLCITISYSFSTLIIFFLLIRFIHGLAWGWSTTANGTAAVELVPSKRLGEGLGYFGLSMTIGMIVAPSLGIFLYQTFGFSTLILVSSILGVIAVVLLFLISYQTPKEVKEKLFNFREFSLLHSLIDKHGWYPSFITLLASFGQGTIVTFIVIFSIERNLDQVFLFYLFSAITATIVRPFVGKWFDKKGPWFLVIGCSISAILGLFILSFTYSVSHLIISGILIGAGFVSMMPVLQSWVISKTPSERRGIANGMFYSSIDLGIGISGIVFGFLSSLISLGTIFQLSSICYLLVILLTIFDLLKIKRKNQLNHQHISTSH